MILLLVSLFVTILVGLKIFFYLTCGICKCDAKMDGKTVIVTGANTGIGYETAKNLAERGARVILACRSVEKGTEAQNKITISTGSTKVVFKQLDLCSLQSVRSFAESVIQSESRLDVLINNAGTAHLDNSLTEDNLPVEAQINYFGPFLLTILLLPLLKRSAPSRIINVSSVLHWYGTINLNRFHKQARNIFEHKRVYSNTKLGNILFTKKLSEDLKGTGVTANAVHPGSVKTDILRNVNILVKFLVRLTFRTPWQGAQTLIYLAVAPELSETSGKYFVDCGEARTRKCAQDLELANKLWDLSYKVTCEKKSL